VTASSATRTNPVRGMEGGFRPTKPSRKLREPTIASARPVDVVEQALEYLHRAGQQDLIHVDAVNPTTRNAHGDAPAAR